MIEEARERLSFARATISRIALKAIPLLIVLSVLVLFAGKPIWLLAITGVAALVLGTLVNPLVGLLALFALGMIGDLQHFERFPSLSVLLLPCVALSFGARSLVARQRVRAPLVMSLVLFVAMYCAGWCREIKGVRELAAPAVFAGYALGFFLVLNIVRTRREIRMVFVAVAIGAAVVSFALITQWFGIEAPLSLLRRPDLPLSAYQAAKDVERTWGFARDPNAAAYPCILAAPVLLALASTTERLWARLSMFAVFGATAVGLVTTQSRSGYLGLAVSLAVFILLAGTRAYRILPLLIILFGVAVAFTPTGEFAARFATIQQDFEADRKIQYEAGFALFVQHPVMGPGGEAFVAEMVREIDAPLQPHSNLLSVLTYSGLLGFVPFLCFILNYARFFFQRWGKVKDRTLKLYAAGAVAAVVGLHVQGLFIGNMGWFLLWAMTAVSICSLLAREERMADAATANYAANQVRRGTDWPPYVSRP
jgi:O-antigen ligase